MQLKKISIIKWCIFRRLYKVVEVSEVPSYDLYPSQIEENTESPLLVSQPKIGVYKPFKKLF